MPEKKSTTLFDFGEGTEYQVPVFLTPTSPDNLEVPRLKNSVPPKKRGPKSVSASADTRNQLADRETAKVEAEPLQSLKIMAIRYTMATLPTRQVKRTEKKY